MKPSANTGIALPTDLKSNNRAQVLDIFKSGESYTANDISNMIGLSRQTVKKSIQYYVEEEILISMGKGDSTTQGGKKPDLFALNPDRYLLCIALLQTRRITLLNLQSEIIDQCIIKEDLSDNFDQVLEELGRASNELLKKHNISMEKLCGVSVSTPGIIRYSTNTLKYNSLNPDWGTNIPLADKLRPYFTPTMPILVENIGKMTARTWMHNPEIQNDRVLVLFTTHGISGCFIDKGYIMNGSNSLIGEIGHMTLEAKSPIKCGCGCNGCFEKMVHMDTIREKIREEKDLYEKSLLSNLAIEDITRMDIFLASEHGDEYGRSLCEYMAYYFSIALHNITVTFDPSMVVLQGEFAYADPYFEEILRKAMGLFQYYPDNGPFKLAYDQNDTDTLDILGSKTFLLDTIFNDTFQN